MLMAQSPMAMLSSPRIRMKQELTDLMPGLHLISCRARAIRNYGLWFACNPRLYLSRYMYRTTLQDRLRTHFPHRFYDIGRSITGDTLNLNADIAYSR